MQDFAVSIREHVKNTGTKPIQRDSTWAESYGCCEKKNPGAAAILKPTFKSGQGNVSDAGQNRRNLPLFQYPHSVLEDASKLMFL